MIQIFVPIPFNWLQVGKALPVDLWTPDGRLLLRRGQALQSEQQRDLLATLQASMTEGDAAAWKKSLHRNARLMRSSGVDLATIVRAPMPSEISDADYAQGRDVAGGWLDLQEVLCGLLYQGAGAANPLPRLEGIEQKALELLRQDPDDCLFCLFQALPDLNMGYCATHALLSGVVCALTADRLALAEEDQARALRSALVMNIGMAHPQDRLARQNNPPDPAQRQIIAAHAPTSADILRGFGVNDDVLLDFVHWHHDPDRAILPAKHQTGLRLLSLSDSLIAKMAPRTSRAAMSPLGAAKSLVLETSPGTTQLRQAMVSVLGFYPPGTYVKLTSGETAVVIKRGVRATAPHVAIIMAASGMPLSNYRYNDTSQLIASHFAVAAPVSAASVNIHVSLEKVRHLRQRHGA